MNNCNLGDFVYVFGGINISGYLFSVEKICISRKQTISIDFTWKDIVDTKLFDFPILFDSI